MDDADFETGDLDHLIDLGELDLMGLPVIEEGRVERTRSLLAFLLLGLLTLVIVAMLALVWSGDLEVSQLGDVSAVLVTPIVGLLGAATGYYYGQKDG